MSYELIGNGEQLLKHDGVNLSADMSTYNNTGAALSNYKYIDYGSFGNGGDDGRVEYIVGQPETFSPYYGWLTYVNTGPSSNNLSSKYGFVSITYDDYRQHSRTEANATAVVKSSEVYYNVKTLGEYKQIVMSETFKSKDNSGNAYILGKGTANWTVASEEDYSIQFVSAINSSSVRYNNNLWKILTPRCAAGTTTGESMSAALSDIWYDSSVLVHPVSGNWTATQINGYTAVDSNGYLKDDGYYYKDKRLIAGKLVKNTVKVLFDLSNNYLYYCDKPNNKYRVILSAKMDKDKALFSNCSSFLEIDNEWECENPWGQGSTCWLFKKNLNVDYLNCPFEEALAYTPAPYTIHKDNVTNWGNIHLTYNDSAKYVVPGDPNVYSDLSYTPSSFSGEGYYVLKSDLSANTRLWYPLTGFLGGNMMKDDIDDKLLNLYVQPLSRAIIPSAEYASGHTYDFNGLATTYCSALPKSGAVFPSGMRGNSNAFVLGNFRSSISNYIRPSANGIKAKWIFYKRKDGLSYNWTKQQLDYCLYDDYISAYRPMGYIRTSDGVNDMTLRNNNVVFQFIGSGDSNSYSASTTTFCNVEFFHTSSYYDALNG